MATGKSIGSKAPAVGRVLSRTPGFLRTQLWAWPLLTAAMLVFVGLWVRPQLERTMEGHIAGNLKVILDANAEALQAWAGRMKSLAELLAGDPKAREQVQVLLVDSQAGATTSGLDSLHAYLQPSVEAHGFPAYAILDTNLVIVACTRKEMVGVSVPSEHADAFAACFAGNATVTRPFLTEGLLRDEKGDLRPGLPMMFAAAPIRRGDGQTIALLGVRILPEKDFTRILATARSGQSGETFAFDRNGLLLSASRFDDELKRMGLIPDTADATSLLALEARDPLVDRRVKQSPKRRSELPLTRAVADAVEGRAGVDAHGYRGYRGVTVAGAWMWLPDFGMGLVTEMERAEAFAPLRPIRYGFWIIFGMLAVAGAIVFLLMRVARQAATRASRLGQYELDKEIGGGAFGTVFLAHHALMRRPVAVKVLDPTADERSIARFEREVQATSQLTHPNTIAIYDYGRTPNDLFYYAMEYLEGLSLSALVKEHGPQPEGRVIHILRQVCASLSEAHARGLIHRDIKPHNILLTCRGGIPDFVKVVDFGLVKVSDTKEELELTGAHATLGTPLYISPEAVKGPDAVTPLSDIYSVGAVGYEMLTGETVFAGTSLGEILLHQVRTMPEKPSARLGRAVSKDLEELLMRCLAKNPSARPSAIELQEALGKCAASESWDNHAAQEWWHRFASAKTNAPAPGANQTKLAP